jgi:hypothetical protein
MNVLHSIESHLHGYGARMRGRSALKLEKGRVRAGFALLLAPDPVSPITANSYFAY